MGYYVNLGNEGFRQIRKDEYIDKSGLLAVLNQTIETKKRFTCMSRPRRFGKSYAAQMIRAYYERTCDSRSLFEDLEIAKSPSFMEHMNRYNTLYLDISEISSSAGGIRNIRGYTDRILCGELDELYPCAQKRESLPDKLYSVVQETGTRFVAIIDEWDSPIRDIDATEDIKKEYLEFLRSLFKNSRLTNQIFAAAFMTGILPIKKDGSHSAISEFREYSIIKPRGFAPFYGFTEEDVKHICDIHGIAYGEMKSWYDGYELKNRDVVVSVYNPNSVMVAAEYGEFDSYWGQSSSADSLFQLLNMDFEGVGEDLVKLMEGRIIHFSIHEFQNDPGMINSRDDLMTLLTHYGYLNYDPESETARIPNEEIKREFDRSVRRVSHKETVRRIKESMQILEDTCDMKAESVAEAIQKIHKEESSRKYYNNEQALMSTLRLAYFTWRDHYIKMEELDSGTDYADVVFLPRKLDPHPALIIELKYNDTPENAIRQIRKKEYDSVLSGYGGELLFVGISYDKNDPEKRHRCVIERG